MFSGCVTGVIVLNGTNGSTEKKKIEITTGTDVHDCTGKKGAAGGN